MIARRSIIQGIVALVAAPAIVKAGSLMVCSPTETLILPRNAMLSINRLTHESVRLFTDSNEFIKNLDYQYDKEFYDGEQWDAAKVGDVLRIRLPNDFSVSDDNRLRIGHPADAFAYAMKGHSAWIVEPVAPQIPTPLAVAALAVAAAPVVEQALQKPVTRRFWSK